MMTLMEATMLWVMDDADGSDVLVNIIVFIFVHLVPVRDAYTIDSGPLKQLQHRILITSCDEKV